MPRGWRVIDCVNMRGSLSSARGAIIVSPEDGDPVRVPTADVAVVLIGVSVSVSGGALHRLFADGVAVMLCDWRGVPEGVAFGWSDHSRIAARRRAQAALTKPRAKNAWARIVKQKIAGQSRCLSVWDESGAKFLRRLMGEVRSGDISNIEGQAARFYWSRLVGGSFVRAPGSGESINGLFDYAYAVLRGYGIRAVLSAGLEPALGMFHKNRSNPFCLVDDLLEIFRPVVDFEVSTLIRSGISRVEDCKSALVAAASVPYSKGGITVPAAFEDFAQQYGKYVEGQLKALEVPGWSADLESTQHA